MGLGSVEGCLARGERGRQRAFEVVVQEEQVVQQVVPDQRLARGAQRAPHAEEASALLLSVRARVRARVGVRVRVRVTVRVSRVRVRVRGRARGRARARVRKPARSVREASCYSR